MLDTSRASERFGFAAHTSFEVGLARTIEWYEAQSVNAAAGIADGPARATVFAKA